MGVLGPVRVREIDFELSLCQFAVFRDGKGAGPTPPSLFQHGHRVYAPRWVYSSRGVVGGRFVEEQGLS
eukprot:1892484-Pyramimonas_sp.AAC.1